MRRRTSMSLVVIGTVLVLLGIGGWQFVLALKEDAAHVYPSESEKIRYDQDPRTHLCFAFLPAANLSVTMSNVPCSPEVLALKQRVD